MARYDAAHKQASRERILEAARREFRTRGFDEVSIDTLMRRAGLTRGAFYAHFDSKEALVLEVLDIEAGLVLQLQAAADAGDHAAGASAVRTYLDPDERRDVASNCPLVCHPVDAIRGDVSRRAAYTDRVNALIAALAELGDLSDDDAVLASILTVGAAQLSAAVGDDQLADRISSAGREAVERVLAISS